MMVDNLKKLQKASEDYILNDTYNLTENILEYIKNRIIANKQEIEELIQLKKEKISYEQILQIVEDEKELDKNYKDYSKLKINEQKFLSSYIKMPIGVIAVETFSPTEVIKYCLKAITTRNAIVISDVEYAEDNIKSLVLLIIKEALKKFEIDDNLIMILPYDECFYDYFDEVIYTYDAEGNLLKRPVINKKDYSNKLYVYLEDETLEDEAIKNENAEIITGKFEEVLPKINNSFGVSIYTKNNEIAYKFIHFAHCKNVFVNTNLNNIQSSNEIDDMFFEYRNIIIPIPQVMANIEHEDSIENKWMIAKKESIFEKIKNYLRRLFI